VFHFINPGFAEGLLIFYVGYVFMQIGTTILSPWSRVLLEKLIVTQLVKKFPVLLRNQRLHYRVHKTPPIPRPRVTFRNKLVGYNEELTPHPTPPPQAGRLSLVGYPPLLIRSYTLYLDEVSATRGRAISW
jgi:hypothetical protein